MEQPTKIYIVSFTARSGDVVIAVYYDQMKADAHAARLNEDPQDLRRHYMDEGKCIVQAYDVNDAGA